MQIKVANFRTVEELTANFQPSDDARPLIDTNLDVLSFIGKLIKYECYADAIKCVALMLPCREAVWWSCQAVKHAAAELSRDEENALSAAEAWAFRPTEENRLLAKLMADKISNSLACAWPALAASWSAGSMSDDQESPVPPPKTLYAHAAACGVLISAVTPPDLLEEQSRRFIKQGVDIIIGGTGQVE